MSILTAVRTKLADLIRPKTEALVLVPRQLSGRWEKVCESGSAVVLWYLYTCDCLQQQKFPTREASVKGIRRCQCGREYSLMHSLVTLTDGKGDPAEYQLRLSNLSTKLAKTEQDKKTVQSVGDEPVNIRWSGRNDAAREKAFDAGDPGAMGPGF